MATVALGSMIGMWAGASISGGPPWWAYVAGATAGAGVIGVLTAVLNNRRKRN